MNTKKILLVIVATIAVTLVLGFGSLYLFTSWMLRKQQAQLFNEKSANTLVHFVQQGQLIGRMVTESCTTREDLSSVGERSKEQQLEVLSQLLTLAEAQTGTITKEIRDLDSLPNLSKPGAAYVSRLETQCSVLPTGLGATMLNCDGLVLTPSIAQVVGTFSPNLRRFYVIEGHEVMFRPAVSCK